jgi:hypothetical protein
VERIVGSLRPIVRGTRFVAPARRPGSISPLARTSQRMTHAVPTGQLAADRRAPLRAIRRAAQGIEIEHAAPVPVGPRLSQRRYRWSAPRHELRGSRAGIAAPWRG